MAYCTNCGSVLIENAHFCVHCGAPRAQSVSPVQEASVRESRHNLILGRVQAGVALGASIFVLMFSCCYLLLAAGFMDAQPSMPVVAMFFAPLSVFPCIAAGKAKRNGCTNKFAKIGVILAVIAFLLYFISVPVLFAKL